MPVSLSLLLAYALSADWRLDLLRGTGVVELPAGKLTLDAPLRIPNGARNLTLRGRGTTLTPSLTFSGRALILATNATGLTIENLTLDGARPGTIENPAGAPVADFPPAHLTFAAFYDRNGILVERSSGVTIRGVSARRIAHYPILLTRVADAEVVDNVITESGSLDPRGKNNGAGGILLEDGCTRFLVARNQLRDIWGNAIWTHSRFEAPRNASGRIVDNEIDRVARDAIQVGHAMRIEVRQNRGRRVGFPTPLVEVAGMGTPVVLDTAGNVSGTIYEGNVFEEINGKCVDLDGFHHGAVRNNTCINRGSAADYPHGHFGIVMNNRNPQVCPEGIEITGNHIEGMRYGGVFVIGKFHRITGNRFLRLNLAGCPDGHAQFGCYWRLEEPQMLFTGIYLGLGVLYPDASRYNVIEDNEMTGPGLDRHCVVRAPGIGEDENTVQRNRCQP